MVVVWPTSRYLIGVLCIHLVGTRHRVGVVSMVGFQGVDDRCVQPSCGIVGLFSKCINYRDDACMPGIFQPPLPMVHISLRDNNIGPTTGTDTRSNIVVGTIAIASIVVATIGSTTISEIANMASVDSPMPNGVRFK